MDITPQLAVWHVSGKSTEVITFQQKLQSSWWPPGGRSPHKHMTPYLEDGLPVAGVLRSHNPISGPVADVANLRLSVKVTKCLQVSNFLSS